ncbi:hypothetical protein BV25DRAFT_1919440 [Artomyces pyxidatus]|uniref:Uncharacterized protein n=1 Tax=Artomyces pyxidatus TaxID=48021 RepID=A0ACB8SPV5_9AGAM|nr:hypothetical protein BV25DRAFT_1919440 [Artomyces pyxidatus]
MHPELWPTETEVCAQLQSIYDTHSAPGEISAIPGHSLRIVLLDRWPESSSFINDVVPQDDYGLARLYTLADVVDRYHTAFCLQTNIEHAMERASIGLRKRVEDVDKFAGDLESAIQDQSRTIEQTRTDTDERFIELARDMTQLTKRLSDHQSERDELLVSLQEDLASYSSRVDERQDRLERRVRDLISRLDSLTRGLPQNNAVPRTLRATLDPLAVDLRGSQVADFSPQADPHWSGLRTNLNSRRGGQSLQALRLSDEISQVVTQEELLRDSCSDYDGRSVSSYTSRREPTGNGDERCVTSSPEPPSMPCQASRFPHGMQSPRRASMVDPDFQQMANELSFERKSLSGGESQQTPLVEQDTSLDPKPKQFARKESLDQHPTFAVTDLQQTPSVDGSAVLEGSPIVTAGSVSAAEELHDGFVVVNKTSPYASSSYRDPRYQGVIDTASETAIRIWGSSVAHIAPYAKAIHTSIAVRSPYPMLRNVSQTSIRRPGLVRASLLVSGFALVAYTFEIMYAMISYNNCV